jgi:glycosyltransferase involved in cell wall biosynthesis
MSQPSIVFLVNGDPLGAMGIRAESFRELLADEFQIRIAYRSGSRAWTILEFLGALVRLRPNLCYVFDMGYSGVLAAGFYRLVSRCRVVVDTGDAIYALSKSLGERGPVRMWLTRLLEWFGFFISDRVVVRSHPHQEMLAERGILAAVIPDGVDTQQFCPREEPDLRRKYDLEGSVVIGILGSLIWSPRWQMCYGWELIELIHLLRDRPVKGFIVGDGSGLAQLKTQCAAHGIEDRVVFAGRVPYHELPRLVNVMDICLSTQSNDVPGQVRTTGKLPIYLACGRYVLSSNVGEAARVLPPEMLVPYSGTKDEEYPRRLAQRIEPLLDHPEIWRQSPASVEIAERCFDYKVLAAKLRQVIYDSLRGVDGGPQKDLAATVPPRDGAGLELSEARSTSVTRKE